MRREQLYHAIRTACTIINRSEVTILGSQSILASFSEDELPKRATLSREIDILPTTTLKPSKNWRISLRESLASFLPSSNFTASQSTASTIPPRSSLPDGETAS